MMTLALGCEEASERILGLVWSLLEGFFEYTFDLGSTSCQSKAESLNLIRQGKPPALPGDS